MGRERLISMPRLMGVVFVLGWGRIWRRTGCGPADIVGFVSGCVDDTDGRAMGFGLFQTGDMNWFGPSSTLGADRSSNESETDDDDDDASQPQ